MTSTSNHCLTPQVSEPLPPTLFCCCCPPVVTTVCSCVHRSVLRTPAVCSLVRGGVSGGGPVAALCGQSHRLRKHAGRSLTLLHFLVIAINPVLKSLPLPLSPPRCRRVPSADSWGRRCVAGKQTVGGATISPALWLQELSWTGRTDMLCVRGTQTQVRIHTRTPLIRKCSTEQPTPRCTG